MRRAVGAQVSVPKCVCAGRWAPEEEPRLADLLSDVLVAAQVHVRGVWRILCLTPTVEGCLAKFVIVMQVAAAQVRLWEPTGPNAMVLVKVTKISGELDW